MTCPRCQNLLIRDESYDLTVSGEALSFYKCLGCARHFEPGYLANQARSLAGDNPSMIGKRNPSRMAFTPSAKAALRP